MAPSLKSHSAENHFTERRQKIMKNIATIRSQLVAASTNEEKELFESTMKLEVAALQRLNDNHSNYIRDPSKYNFPKNAGTAALRKRSMPLTDFKVWGRDYWRHTRVSRVIPSSLFVGPLHSIEITFKMKSKGFDWYKKGKVCLAILQDGEISRILKSEKNSRRNVYEDYKILYRPEQQGLKYGLCCKCPQGDGNSLKIKDIIVTTFTHANVTGSSGVSTAPKKVPREYPSNASRGYYVNAVNVIC